MRNQAQKKQKVLHRNPKKRSQLQESGCVSIAPPAGDNEGEIDWVKVEMLRAAVETGTYVVDPHLVAEAIIDRERRFR